MTVALFRYHPSPHSFDAVWKGRLAQKHRLPPSDLNLHAPGREKQLGG
jgi:hypothetical protein